MEGSTEHWTSAKKPLLGSGALTEKVYRFYLGKDKINLVPIGSLTNVERWEAAYTNNNHQTDAKNFSLMIAIGRKVKQRLVARYGTYSHRMERRQYRYLHPLPIFSDFNEPNIAEDIYLIYSHWMMYLSCI